MPKSIRMIQPAHRIVGYHSKTTDKNKFARGEGPIGPMQEPRNIILFYLFYCSRDLRRVVGLNGTGVRLKRSPSCRAFFVLSHLMEIPMIRCTTLMLIATAIVTMSLSTAYGQTRTNQNRNNPKDSDEKPTPPPLPTDQRLLALHRLGCVER